MVEEGVSTFKVFLAYKDVLMVTDDQFLAVLEQTGETGGLVMVHAENGHAIDLLVRQALAAGNTDPIYHALTRPKQLEAEATGRAIRLAEYAGRPVFIVHVTCREAAEEIISARARGVPAYGETCLQYLFFEQDDLARPNFEGARYVCSPPLRTKADQAFLWDALAYDHLQLISTDHCPFNDEQKRLGLGDFSKIPNGVPLIQHRVNLLWEHGVRTGRLTPSRAVELMSTAPARIFGLTQKGSIAPGKDADIAIFDPGREHVFSTSTSLMAVDYDLLDGRRTAGSVRTTLVRGTTVWDDGKILTKPGHGRFVRRATYGGTD
jgi:dihydropyrimidinase